MEELLDIAEVSDQSGVSTSWFRYYENRKLIGAVARNGLPRQYEPVVLQELALISLAKSTGFTHDEIGSVLIRPGATVIPRGALIDKAGELEYQSERLVNFAEMQRSVANCPYEDHFECSRFQKLLNVATRITKD